MARTDLAGPLPARVLGTRAGRAGTVSILVLTTAAALAVRDPHQDGSWGRCPVLALTGRYCPGCGALRALADLLHGHLGAAVGSNALLVLAGLPALAVLTGRWVLARPARAVPRWAYVTGLLVLVAFTVARNTPAGRALAP